MNIKAVAKQANVSTATVSRTINGSDKVSPRTAERVQRAIETLNFYPNTDARVLGSGRSSLYGLIVSDITNPFFPELVKAFEDIAIAHGKEVLIANTDYAPERMKICVTRMLQRRVDGLAIMTSEMDDRLMSVFSHRNIPLVFLNAGTPASGISYVQIDYETAIDTAMQHLVDLGHRSIAFISGPKRLPSVRARLNVYCAFSSQHQLASYSNPNMVQEADHRAEGGYAAMQRILQGTAAATRPTAILASNDLTAIGAMGAITEAGLRVPQDISVIGCDDIQLSAFTMPALTTISLPRAEIARASFRALLNGRASNGKTLNPGEAHKVGPNLVVRKSTGPAPR